VELLESPRRGGRPHYDVVDALIEEADPATDLYTAASTLPEGRVVQLGDTMVEDGSPASSPAGGALRSSGNPVRDFLGAADLRQARIDAKEVSCRVRGCRQLLFCSLMCLLTVPPHYCPQAGVDQIHLTGWVSRASVRVLCCSHWCLTFCCWSGGTT